MITADTRRFFQEYAQDFEAIYGNRNTWFNSFINRNFRQAMRTRYEKTIEGCSPVEGKTVLDVGCGPGHYSVELARRGAGKVIGIDFAAGMLELARKRAQRQAVEERCEFLLKDVNDFEPGTQFDYVIAMGFMDYIKDAAAMVKRLTSLTRGKAFFSFPVAGGWLGLQRRIRYKYQHHCELYMYEREDVERLFEGIPSVQLSIDPIGRDLFVTASRK